VLQIDALHKPAGLSARSRQQNLPRIRRDLIANPGHPPLTVMRTLDWRFIEQRSAM